MFDGTTRTRFALLVVFALLASWVSHPLQGYSPIQNQEKIVSQEAADDADIETRKDKKSKSKIKFSQWDDFLIWLASSEKWSPIISQLKTFMRSLFGGTSGVVVQSKPGIIT